MQVSDQQCQLLMKEDNYFRVEKYVFVPGHEQEEWLAAEQQVDDLLSSLGQAEALAEQLETVVNPHPNGQEVSVAEGKISVASIAREKATAGEAGIDLPAEGIVSHHSSSSLKKPRAIPDPATIAA